MRYWLYLACLLFVACAEEERGNMPVYTISPTPVHAIDDRLFGAFFEKATWGGEIGSEAAISLTTGEVFPEVKAYMDWMQIPLLRFPGGTAIDYYPWYHLIDSMPGRHGGRPRNAHVLDPDQWGVVESDGRMGLHEYMALCRELAIEPHLVVNLGEGYYGHRTPAAAAETMGADFVRYCNATTGPWAALRAANGSPEPFAVKYWQIGNETWLFEGLEFGKRTEAAIARLTENIVAYARAMKAADPSIQLIVDGAEGLGDGARAEVGDLIDYYTFHAYTPWAIRDIRRDTTPVRADTLDPAEVWRGLVAAPRIDSLTGLSMLDPWAYDNLPDNLPLAVTEWNWNGWFAGAAKPARPANELLAYGIGSASFLHALLREGDRIRLANQSMLVGTNWRITGIRVDTTEAERPTMYPSALVTGLYSRHHGDELLDYTLDGGHYYAQPLQLGQLRPAPKVAEQDVVVTADSTAYYLHLINRSYDRARSLRFEFPGGVGGYTHYLISEAGKGNRSAFAGVSEASGRWSGEAGTIRVPERSVSVVRVRKE